MKRIILVSLALAACYRPNTELACTLACDQNGASTECPNELSCNMQGLCSIGGAMCVDSGMPPDDGMPNPDGPMPDDPPGLFCLGTPPIRPCFNAPPVGNTSIGLSLDSDSNTDCDAQTLGGRSMCVVAADTLVFSVRSKIGGARPIVFVAKSTLTINANGIIDVSSSNQLPPRRGAGSDPVECDTTGAGQSANNNQDGAGGGGFATGGGQGGAGPAGMNNVGGASLSTIEMRGGCRGGNSNGQVGGRGGGAVYLISGNQIAIDGVIIAAGGGGEGGTDSSGGAGGGAGGYIGVDAPLVTHGNQARVIATGGGGGGGGCMGDPGGPGEDPDTAASIVADGGPGASGDGDGGNGAGSVNGAPGLPGQDDATPQCAGGGGGGGLGSINYFQNKTCPVNACTPDAVKHP